MLTGSELALDRAQIDRAMTRESAIMAKASLAGYSFIRLRLKNIKRKKIVGVEAIIATDFTNADMGGITDYYIEVKGGEIDFRFRPELGMYVFDLLDTELNRNFLASHYGGDYWEIMDRKVESDIAFRAEKIAAEMRKGKTPTDAPKKFWKEVRASEAQAIRAARGEMDTTDSGPESQEPEPEKPQEAKRTATPLRSEKPPVLHPINAMGKDSMVNVSHETVPLGVGVIKP